jgi:hypothetical protein
VAEPLHRPEAAPLPSTRRICREAPSGRTPAWTGLRVQRCVNAPLGGSTPPRRSEGLRSPSPRIREPLAVGVSDTPLDPLPASPLVAADQGCSKEVAPTSVTPPSPRRQRLLHLMLETGKFNPLPSSQTSRFIADQRLGSANRAPTRLAGANSRTGCYGPLGHLAAPVDEARRANSSIEISTSALARAEEEPHSRKEPFLRPGLA